MAVIITNADSLRQISTPINLNDISTLNRDPQPFDLVSRESEIIIRSLAELLPEKAFGLAAPQIHVSKQITVLGGMCSSTDDDIEVPKQVLINPELTPIGEETMPSIEGCLSLPGLRGITTRYKHISVVALDENEKEVEFEAHDFHAIVIQHETDHLFGRLYIDRLISPVHLAYEDEFERYYKQFL